MQAVDDANVMINPGQRGQDGVASVQQYVITRR